MMQDLHVQIYILKLKCVCMHSILTIWLVQTVSAAAFSILICPRLHPADEVYFPI